MATELQLMTSPTGDIFLRRDDLVAVLKEMGDHYLGHIPKHSQAGEFMEALQDRWTAQALEEAAKYFESIKSIE